MSKVIFGACIFLTLIGCAANDRKNNSANNDALPKTLEPFADSMVRLNKTLGSIDAAAGYYQRLVPADSTLADSAAVMFLRHVGSVVDTTNEKLFQDTTDYFELVYNQNKNVPEKQKQFQQNLANHHVILQGDGEGSVYGVPDYQWINQIVQSKTSSAVDAYLALVAKEEKNPTLLDAGLAVEMEELADRLIATERLRSRNLLHSFTSDLAQKNKFYTGTLLFGSDNSPALEYNEIRLVEEFKKGYDYLQTAYPTSNAAQLVKEWQTIIAAKDSRKVEEWRKKYNAYE